MAHIKKRVTISVLLLILAVGILSILYYGYFSPSAQLFGSTVYKGAANGKLAALTFDDGPNEPYTSQLLDLIKEYNITATFFVIGKNVEIYPNTARRILMEGHVLGEHSYNHLPNHALTDFNCNDVKLAQEAILNLTRVSPRLYRPPFGRKTPWELQCIKGLGLLTVMWSDSTNDEFQNASGEAIAKKIIANAGPGSILLLHDGFGTCHNCSGSDKTQVLKAVRIIIENLKSKGYKFVTLPELLGTSAYK